MPFPDFSAMNASRRENQLAAALPIGAPGNRFGGKIGRAFDTFLGINQFAKTADAQTG
jgi:hypothetical protein